LKSGEKIETEECRERYLHVRFEDGIMNRMHAVRIERSCLAPNRGFVMVK